MGDNLADMLPEVAITLGARPTDWREAITVAGDALAASGATTDEYTREMIAAVEELGPYIVIAPGLALAHSRPSPSVLRAGLSWVTLSEPIEFGSPNDPVTLVIGLAATEQDGHLEVMSSLAGILADDDQMAQLEDADSPARLRELLTRFSGSGD